MPNLQKSACNDRAVLCESVRASGRYCPKTQARLERRYGLLTAGSYQYVTVSRKKLHAGASIVQVDSVGQERPAQPQRPSYGLTKYCYATAQRFHKIGAEPDRAVAFPLASCFAAGRSLDTPLIARQLDTERR